MQGADDHLITVGRQRFEDAGARSEDPGARAVLGAGAALLSVLLGLLPACGGGGGGDGGAAGRGGASGLGGAGAGGTGGGAGDAGVDSGVDSASIPCTGGGDCPARHFCGVRSRRCVSAVVEVVGGTHHSCARHEDGRVSCWGLAESLLAGGSVVLAPDFVSRPELQGARKLAASEHLTCAVTAQGRVTCWGNRDLAVLTEDGQRLGGVLDLALGAGYGCAATAAGVWCWGSNRFGQLARPLGLTDSSAALPALSAPQRAPGLGAGVAVVSYDGAGRLCAWGRNATKMINDLDGVDVQVEPQCRSVSDVEQLVVGDTHACLRHRAGGFTCWGERYYGQLGLGGDETADVPPPGTAVTLDMPVAALAAGVSHTCALLAGGQVTCFGRGHLGQLGPGAGPGTPHPAEEVRRPVPVTGLPGPAVSIWAGSAAQHTCAVVADGSVWCWGDDHAGQLGGSASAQAATVTSGRVSRNPVQVAW